MLTERYIATLWDDLSSVCIIYIIQNTFDFIGYCKFFWSCSLRLYGNDCSLSNHFHGLMKSQDFNRTDGQSRRLSELG